MGNNPDFLLFFFLFLRFNKIPMNYTMYLEDMFCVACVYLCVSVFIAGRVFVFGCQTYYSLSRYP